MFCLTETTAQCLHYIYYLAGLSAGPQQSFALPSSSDDFMQRVLISIFELGRIEFP